MLGHTAHRATCRRRRPPALTRTKWCQQEAPSSLPGPSAAQQMWAQRSRHEDDTDGRRAVRVLGEDHPFVLGVFYM